MSQNTIKTKSVRYIKLGRNGMWEKECLEKGIIRMGFGTGYPERFKLCKSRKWDELRKSFSREHKDKGTATRFTNELHIFFEDDGGILWITFMNERLYWGFVDNSPSQRHPDDDGVWRNIKGGWRDTDIDDNILYKTRLSGALTKLAAYRGTSCDVDVSKYVILRINGQKMPAVEQTIAVSKKIQTCIHELIKMLTPQDFELLVDLVFSSSGWRRVGVVGKTQKMLDIDLILPSTGERAFVQVKSHTSKQELSEYVEQFKENADLYNRMFYVYHSGKPLSTNYDLVTIIGPEKLSEMVFDAGLTKWLIDKVS